jgi:hypothetical protein
MENKETNISFDAIVEKCATIGDLKNLIHEHRIISRKEKPNSYEIGKAGNRFNLVFDTAEDLKQQIEDLESKGFSVGGEQ